ERDVVRYWVISLTATLIEDPGEAAVAMRTAVERLARQATHAGLPTHVDRNVSSLNAATTTAFFPLIAAIDAGGGIDGVLADKDLLALAISAAKECDRLARRLGKVAPWARLLTSFVRPFTLKPSVVLMRSLFPDSVRFVDAHFGAKLHAQHLAMGHAIL